MLHLYALYHCDFSFGRPVNGDVVCNFAAARRSGRRRVRRGMMVGRIGAREIKAGELARVGYRTLRATSREFPFEIRERAEGWIVGHGDDSFS